MIKKISDNKYLICMRQNYCTEQFIKALLYSGYIVGLTEVTGDFVDIFIYEENETKYEEGNFSSI